MIPSSTIFDQSTLAALLDHDPLIQEDRAFFALFDWALVERWQAARSSRGRPPHPESAYLKAFLLRIKEGLQYTKELRAYLVQHSLLIIELGFTLVLDPQAPYGFDVERTLPSRYWLGEKLRRLDRHLLSDLLASIVQALKGEIPGLGEVVAFDVKHLYAWVKENNWRAYVPERYDKTRIPAGDPDCALGVSDVSLPAAASSTHRRELRPCPICQRPRLCQAHQHRSGRLDARPARPHRAPSITLSITNAPRANASTARPRHSASSALASATAAPLPTSTPSSLWSSMAAPSSGRNLSMLDYFPSLKEFDK
jgi:hypothetical protein